MHEFNARSFRIDEDVLADTISLYMLLGGVFFCFSVSVIGFLDLDLDM